MRRLRLAWALAFLVVGCGGSDGAAGEPEADSSAGLDSSGADSSGVDVFAIDATDTATTSDATDAGDVVVPTDGGPDSVGDAATCAHCTAYATPLSAGTISDPAETELSG